MIEALTVPRELPELSRTVHVKIDTGMGRLGITL